VTCTINAAFAVDSFDALWRRVLTHTLNYLFLHFAVTHFKLCVRVYLCVCANVRCCLIHLAGNALFRLRFQLGFGLRRSKSRTRTRTSRETALYICTCLPPLSHSLFLLPFSFHNLYLFR